MNGNVKLIHQLTLAIESMFHYSSSFPLYSSLNTSIMFRIFCLFHLAFSNRTNCGWISFVTAALSQQASEVCSCVFNSSLILIFITSPFPADGSPRLYKESFYPLLLKVAVGFCLILEDLPVWLKASVSQMSFDYVRWPAAWVLGRSIDWLIDCQDCQAPFSSKITVPHSSQHLPFFEPWLFHSFSGRLPF